MKKVFYFIVSLLLLAVSCTDIFQSGEDDIVTNENQNIFRCKINGEKWELAPKKISTSFFTK
jgi:hypothetical protein